MSPMLVPSLALLFLGQAVVLGQQPPRGKRVYNDKSFLNRIEAQAIKTLLDGVKAEDLAGEKFMVMLYDDHGDYNVVTVPETKPKILAWFRYGRGEQRIAVNYFFLVPPSEKVDLQNGSRASLYYAMQDQLKALLREIVNGKVTVNDEKVRRLDMPLPVGLRDDVLFDKMRRIYEYDPYSNPPFRLFVDEAPTTGKNKVALRWRSYGARDLFYYWGIKSSKIEYIRSYDHYFEGLSNRIFDEILWPIAKTILEHETPEYRPRDFRKWQEDMQRKLGEQRDIWERLKQKSQGAEQTE